MMLDMPENWDEFSLPAPTADLAAQRRRAVRTTKVMLVGKLIAEGHEQLCKVLNVSASGLMMSTASSLSPGERVRIEFKNGRELGGTIVWSRPPNSGMRFDAPIDVEQMLSSEVPTATGRPTLLPRAPRLSTDRIALVRCAGRTLPAHLLDLSQGGAKVRLTNSLMPGDQLSIAVAPHPAALGTVRWVRDNEVGIAFFNVLPFDQVARWLDDPHPQ